jgi:hypothetical protein
MPLELPGSPAPEPNKPPSERRKLDRFPPQGWIAKVSLPRTFMGFGGGDALSVPLLDLSETGARVLFPKAIDKGAQIRVRIEDPKFKEVVEWTARVVWVNPPPPIATTWVVGVEFVELSRDLKLRIQGWRSFYTSEEYKKQLDDSEKALTDTKKRRAIRNRKPSDDR